MFSFFKQTLEVNARCDKDPAIYCYQWIQNQNLAILHQKRLTLFYLK